ncbi:MAG TPA: glutathione S-transferase N-terminal domain-containing protein [Burkholderiales bacterium]|nr:glutathione S-transferase N-terminal domain-containing protein [Burkholderiales bacterium]
MKLELYFAPGACSFVPHVGLEAAQAEFEPKLIKLHKGEHRTPAYLAMNPNGQVPVLMIDGKALTQIVAICDFLDRRFPDAGLLPKDSWERSQALSQLAWMNSTPHTTATRFFFPERYAESDTARAEVKKRATEDFRGYLERIQNTLDQKSFWFRDAYLFTLLRWGGFAGIDTKSSLPAYYAYAQKLLEKPPVAAAVARERISLDTYKA